MLRDKQVTRARILAAVGEILSHQGFSELGVNAIAKKAGVDKVLIYRYYGDLDRLLKAYADENPSAISPPPLAWPPREKAMSPAATTALLLCEQLEELRRRPVAQATVRCAFLDGNPLTELFAVAREKMVKEYLARISFDQEKHPECDLGAVFALLHAGLTHLVVSAPRTDFYQGIDLKSARGWKRIEKAIDDVVSAYFKAHETQPSDEEPSPPH
jgi:AcrR family transcriptional regulator